MVLEDADVCRRRFSRYAEATALLVHLYRVELMVPRRIAPGKTAVSAEIVVGSSNATNLGIRWDDLTTGDAGEAHSKV